MRCLDLPLSPDRATHTLCGLFAATFLTIASAQTDPLDAPAVPETCILLSENFDRVIPPANPWGGPWITTTIMPDSPPNCVFIDDPAFVNDAPLLAPAISITSTPAQLSFRNFYNLEDGFDGGVLEVSINGGAFSDIRTAGATFVSGGYNRTISIFFGSPIAGRQAWSGNSGGYIDTVINLGSNIHGTIQLRWRRVSDNAGAGAGWRIDNVVLTQPGCAPTVVSAVSRKTHGASGDFEVALPLTGTVEVECRRGGGAAFDSHQVVVTFTNSVTLSGVTVSSPDGGSATASYGASGNQVTVNLSNATDQHTLVLALNNVNDGTGTGDVIIPMAVLRGDTTADRLVNSGDTTQTKNRGGQATDAMNFRSDVNTDGAINSGDTNIVRNASGNFVP